MMTMMMTSTIKINIIIKIINVDNDSDDDDYDPLSSVIRMIIRSKFTGNFNTTNCNLPCLLLREKHHQVPEVCTKKHYPRSTTASCHLISKQFLHRR